MISEQNRTIRFDHEDKGRISIDPPLSPDIDFQELIRLEQTLNNIRIVRIEGGVQHSDIGLLLAKISMMRALFY